MFGADVVETWANATVPVDTAAQAATAEPSSNATVLIDTTAQVVTPDLVSNVSSPG